MSKCLVLGAIIGLLTIGNVKAADVTCKIEASPPPIDCSTGASLKRGWTPHVCRGA